MLHSVDVGIPAGSTGTFAGDLIKLVQGGLNTYNQYKVDKAIRDANVAAIKAGTDAPYPDAQTVPRPASSIPTWVPLVGLGVLGVMLARGR